MKTVRLLIVAGLAWLSVAPAGAQEAAPTFKSGVDLVRFDVSVFDAAGQPIKDLLHDEIEVHDSGRRLPVVMFQRITEPRGAYVDAAIQAVTAQVTSNEAFPRGHQYIFIFDQQHIAAGHEQRAVAAAQEFLRTRVRPSDRVALFALPGPGPQLRFTSDLTRIRQELRSIRGFYQRVVSTPLGTMNLYEAHRIVDGDEKLIVDILDRMSSDSADIGASSANRAGGRALGGVSEDAAVTRRLLRENARTIVNQSDSDSRQFLQRLADVVAGFRDIDGRKTVVFFSEGFFPDNLGREIETVAAAAAQSYCVFYPFDLNRRGLSPDEGAAPATTLASDIHARIAPLATLAVETGGTMVIDAAARTDALDALADRAQDYYLIGFEPSPAGATRGQYRRVTVKVKRPGATVSARTGYTLAPLMTAADRRTSIDAALGAPFVQQGLKVDYTTYILKAPEAGQHRIVLSLTADLPIRAQSSDTADVVFVARDVHDGRVAASGTDVMRLPATARPGATLGTGAWRVQFTLPAGTYLMRTVVREPGGLVGSADRRIDVRPLDGLGFAVSDLVVGSSGSGLPGLPVHPRAYTGDGLVGVIETYGRTPAQMQDLDVAIELRGERAPATVSFRADIQEPETDGTAIVRRARFVMPLTGVPPGPYVAHATVKVRGEVVAERMRHVEIMDGRAPAATGGSPPMAVPPAEIVRGELARKYIAWLVERARGAEALEAARHASQDRWEHVELALQRMADDPAAVPQALRGLALFVREDYAGAAAALTRAATAAPDSAPTAFFLGWAREGAGDSRAAIGAWRNAAYLDPTLLPAHLALADAYVRIAQPALAIQALRAGLAALPDSFELRDRLSRLEQLRVPPSPSTR